MLGDDRGMKDGAPSDILQPRPIRAAPPFHVIQASMMTQTLLVNAQQVFDGSQRGVAIAVAGLLIVFTALLLITLFIASLPRLLGMLARGWPEVDEHHHWESHPESFLPENDTVLAAIGFVLHTEFQKQLKADETRGEKN